jgi:hypothetical protein
MIDKLSIITNFKENPILFKSNTIFHHDIDFDYIDFLINKYKYKKIAISGGTDPIFNLRENAISIELIKKTCASKKLQLYIYTKDSAFNDKLYFIKYIKPTKLIVCSSCVDDKLSDSFISAAKISKLRFYLDYNNQVLFSLNLWAEFYSKIVKDVQLTIKQNKINVSDKIRSKIDNRIRILDKGDYSQYLMGNNKLYQDFAMKIPLFAGYKPKRIVAI